MNASTLLFPAPRKLRTFHGSVVLPHRIALAEGPAAWLYQRLSKACRIAGVRLVPLRGRRSKPTSAPLILIRTQISRQGFEDVVDPGIRAQAYCLELRKDGTTLIRAPGPEGLQHGLITLCQLLEAAGRGAALSPLVITDIPAFRVRGIQLDLARDFFPPLAYLKRIVDRLADLKMNALWLYLENHFRAPGLEDISPVAGLTRAQAREISAYAAARGVDVVPATNLISHMEGWFRLERYSDLSDGRMRSYPVLTRKEAWPLVRKFMDAIGDAFPSKNFHAGLDELLFTGENPEAARAIKRLGKARYYAQFAGRVVRYLLRKGKVVWYWDDMLTGKNVNRPEGFNRDAPVALRAIPRKNTVLTHWWYWTEKGRYVEDHPAIMRKIARHGRPFVVASSSMTYPWNYGSLRAAGDNQVYLARSGVRHGAFGYICTHWGSQQGHSFEAAWPLLAMSAGEAWSGGTAINENFLRRLSFALSGETGGALGRYLTVMQEIEDLIRGSEPSSSVMRTSVMQHGLFRLWRKVSPALDPRARRRLRALLSRARLAHVAMGAHDADLFKGMAYPLEMFERLLNAIDYLDQAWAQYHRAAEVERVPGRRPEFTRRIANTVDCIRSTAAQIGRLVGALRRLALFGQTPYDAYALDLHRRALLEHVIPLIQACVRDGNGLPNFEKLFYLPDHFHISNLLQLQTSNEFSPRHNDLPWPVRWVKI